jgi:hypothetical protein
MHTYILHNHIYCARCVAGKPHDLVDDNYGKMRPHWNPRTQEGEYLCIARDRGYHACGQSYVLSATIDAQVAAILARLEIPDGYRERVEQAVQNRVDNAAALQRMKDIQEIVERIDFSWEHGFLKPEEYLEKRQLLQKEMESLRPVDYDELMEAADLLENFTQYWQHCETLEDADEARQQLIAKIVDKAFVYDNKIVAIALYGDFSVILDNGGVAPIEVLTEVEKAIKKGADSAPSDSTQSGSDGHGTLVGCWLWVPTHKIYHLVVAQAIQCFAA